MSTPSALWDSSLSGVSKPELHRYRPNKEPRLTLHSRRLSPASEFTAPMRTTTINNDNETKKKLLSGHFYYIKVHRGRLVEQLGLWTPNTDVYILSYGGKGLYNKTSLFMSGR